MVEISPVVRKKVIYKITYPNGKVYIGKDLTNSLTDFGSVNDALVKMDFTEEQRKHFTITKEILFESESTEEVNRIEAKLIVQYGANSPQIGYNQ
ncbi:MAG TPA: GIY-YIG nuclease family protein [Cellvibrio sp.]